MKDQDALIDLATTRDPATGNFRTHEEIADILGKSRSTITKALAQIKKTNPSLLEARDVESYRKHRADAFAEIQRTILRYITPSKLQKASINQLGTLFGIFYDKEQLERGRPTSMTVQQIESNLSPKMMQKIQEAIAYNTQLQLEQSRKAAQIEHIQEAEVIDDAHE